MDNRYNPNNTADSRQCADCKRILPRSSFHKSAQKHDGLVPYCKDCWRVRNAKTYEAHRTKTTARRNALKAECAALLGGKCSRCGYSKSLAALDFHHERDKEGEINGLITKASAGNAEKRSLLLQEVSKCILLCANCHRELHSQEQEIA